MPTIKTSKEQVLQSVIETIRQKGIANSSMSDLAKQCNIQKSHFYYYFENKEALIQEVLAMVNSYMTYNMNKVVDNPELDIGQKLSGIRLLIHKLFLDNDGGCVMANTALESAHSNPKYFEEIRSFFQNFITGLERLLQDSHSKEKSRYLAEQIVQDIEGGILLMRVYRNPKYLQNAITRMSNIILP